MTRSKGVAARWAKNRDEVERLFKLGWSDERIARALGMSPKSVQDVRLKRNLLRPKVKPPAPIKKVDDEYLTREFNETIRVPQKARDFEEVHRQVQRIARAAQVDPRTVRRRLQALSLLEIDTRSKPKAPEVYARAQVLLQDGLPYAEVARELRMESSTLRRRFPGLGVRPEDHGTYLAAKQLERSLGLD
jgi:AraC-like DNA-binding protein